MYGDRTKALSMWFKCADGGGRVGIAHGGAWRHSDTFSLTETTCRLNRLSRSSPNASPAADSFVSNFSLNGSNPCTARAICTRPW